MKIISWKKTKKIECKITINNGWDNINNNKILNNCITHRNFKKINVLKIKKSELDKSLNILEYILDKNTNTFKSLPENYENDNINNLNDDWLPRGARKNDLLKAISDKRNTFRYKINEPNNEFDDDGLHPEIYQKILKSLNETQEWKFNKWKNKVTPEFLNIFLKDFLKRKGDENLQEKNLDKWLKGEDSIPDQDKLKGYTLIDKPKYKIKIAEIIDSKFTGNIINDFEISGAEVLKKEAELDKSLAGTYLLPYVFNLIEFDPDELKNNDGSYNFDKFAKVKDTIIKLKKGGEIKRKLVDIDGHGILPILTGGGKTTKLVRCLLTCIFPGKHIILITPNKELAADAENHHNTWLQYSKGIPYKCVIHGKKGELPYIVKNGELASWINGNTKEKKSFAETGKSTLSILQLYHLVRYIACEKVKINELKDPKNIYNDFDKIKINIKEKLIDKDDTIIIFDEAHFPNTSYQVVQPLLIRMGYKVLLMSATFPKKNFSISTSKPREVYSITKFGNQTDWENEKTLIFLRTTADEYPRKINGEEDTDAEPLIKSGLTPTQFKLLEESDIPYVMFNDTNSSAVAGIIEGMPHGLFFVNINHEMGISPDVDNVILTGETQLSKLGKGSGAERWIYDDNDIRFLSVASMVQQIGRVGRLKKGKAFLTTQQLEELVPTDDIVFHIINGIMLPASEEPMKKLNSLGYPFTKNITDHKYQNFLWASIAFPTKKNRPVEAVMVGVKGNPKPSSANQICPTFDNLPDPDVKDNNLWTLHVDGELPPPELDIDNIKNIQLLIIKTKLKAIDINNTLKIYIESKNSLIEKVWDLPFKKSDTIPDDKKNIIINEIKGIMKNIISEKIDVEKIKYKSSEKEKFNTAIKWFKFYNDLNINILRTTIDEKKYYNNNLFNSVLDLFLNNINNNNNNNTNNDLFHLLKKQISNELNISNLNDNGYYDNLIKNNKNKLNSKYTTIQEIRKNHLNYLKIYNNILSSIENECIIETLENKNFIQINDNTFPEKLYQTLNENKNKKIIKLKNIINDIKILINSEKKSLNLKDSGLIFNIINNEKCFSEKTKASLYNLKNIRLNNVLKYEKIKNDIIIISDNYDYNKFDTKKISYLPNDLKLELNHLLINKKKFLEIYNELKNINNWNNELLDKLDNHYKNIINQLIIDSDKKILENIRIGEIQKTLIFLKYKKTIENEIKIENLIRNNKNTIIYNINNDININQSQKNKLINNIISDKINNSMDNLYDELLIQIDKKTFFSTHKTNIVHLMLHKLDQRYLTNRDINTIFKKFLSEELEDAIIDYKKIKTNIDDDDIKNNLQNYLEFTRTNFFIKNTKKIINEEDMYDSMKLISDVYLQEENKTRLKRKNIKKEKLKMDLFFSNEIKKIADIIKNKIV
ncbi:8832_t:CDS:2 [Cetraspora pellucida]|uniref:8832_t:CDS:1 n=1 Tax=Cetraspora pellucida TaxID=1433469 RepID=A0A9N8VFG8_9GLOM|nr:8832_t:CDS:2 [Cetraspora pellucida]